MFLKNANYQFFLTSKFYGFSFFCASLFFHYPANAQSIIPRAPDIAATSYILMDARTGHVIVEEMLMNHFLRPA